MTLFVQILHKKHSVSINAVSFCIGYSYMYYNKIEINKSLLILLITDRNVELYPQFFLELITTQLRFYMVSPQLFLLRN